MSGGGTLPAFSSIYPFSTCATRCFTMGRSRGTQICSGMDFHPVSFAVQRRRTVLQTLFLLNAASTNADGPSMDELHGQDAGAGFPLKMEHGDSKRGGRWIWIRYMYHGGKMNRDGRLIRLSIDNHTKQDRIPSSLVLDTLQGVNVDLDRFSPHAYDNDLEAWAPIVQDTSFKVANGGPPRIDVQLFSSLPMSTHNPEPSSLSLPKDDVCYIGIYGAKAERNLGTLWRSGFQLGAESIFVVGERFKSASKRKRKDDMLRVKQNLGRSHMLRGEDSIPLEEFADWNEFFAAVPPDTPLVAVEMGGQSLAAFKHPPRAVYVLGAEDTGLPQSVIQACDFHVELPCIRSASFNVAVAGSIVLYDRVVKHGADAGSPEEGSGDGGGKAPG